MCEAWGEDVLKIKECRVMYGESKQMLFHGPRVKMGIYKGIPARICPHTTTGRADYFGPLVNRFAPRWKEVSSPYPERGTADCKRLAGCAYLGILAWCNKQSKRTIGICGCRQPK